VLQKLARKLEILTAVYWVVCGPNLSNILLPTDPVSKNGQDTGDHLYGKPGNVRDFDSCQGNVRDFLRGVTEMSEKMLSEKSGLKLFFVSCIFASIPLRTVDIGETGNGIVVW